MPDNERNSWDHANGQGQNLDYNRNEKDEEIYRKKDDIDAPESNSSRDAEGHGSEAGRSEPTESPLTGSRSDNSDADNYGGSRSSSSDGENYGGSGRTTDNSSENYGGGGRSS